MIHIKTSMKTVKDRFMKAPYGFVEDDVHWLVAKLFKRGDLAFTVNGASVNLNNKSTEEIISYITKKTFAEKLLMEVRIRVPEKDKKAVRDVMKEVFGTGSASDDEDTIMKNFQRYAQNMVHDILLLEPQYQRYAYPGKKVLDTGKRLMQYAIQVQEPLDFFQKISKMRDAFYDFAEDYEQVNTFFGGEQQEIFTRALDMLAIYEDSKTYIVDSELEQIVREIRTIVTQEKPYKNIPKLPALREKFMTAYGKVLSQEEKPVLDTIEQCRKRVMEELATKEYADHYTERYNVRFEEIRDCAEHCHSISSLRSYADKANALKIRLLNEMTARDNEIAKRKAEEAKRKAEEEARKAREAGETVTVQTDTVVVEFKEKRIKNVPVKELTHMASWRLESKEDVEKALYALRGELLAKLEEYDVVNVEF